MALRSLPALAIAMAALAAVLLPIAIARRCGSGAEEPPPPPPPRPTPEIPLELDDEAFLAAIYGAFCRHQIACGIEGTEQRCVYIENTMRRMPKKLAPRPCTFDRVEARRCIADLLTSDCKIVAKSLDFPDLQAALDRVPSCRRACAPTASSP